MFGFERIGVVLGDLYFVNPEPIPGQESPERGVRLEVRLLEHGHVDGSVYASQPITIGRPVWRADLLESADGPPGSFDRTHHHPKVRQWEPGRRVFDEALSADPVSWVGDALRDLNGLLDSAEISPSEAGPNDGAQLAAAVPEILETLTRLLARVHSGELAIAPEDGSGDAVRVGWL
jgi:hypothetical protein